MGHHHEATQLLERVVEARKRALGDEHPATLGSIHGLAWIYSKVGHHHEAT
jgi:Tetratricopeptide repeat